MNNSLLSMVVLGWVALGLVASGSAAEPKAKPKKTIAQIVTSDPNFSMLVSAVQAADLSKTLNGRGPFTVFAPTNAAFKKLPKKTWDNLLKPENKEQLVAVLNCHIVRGRVRAAEVAKLEQAETLDGQQAKITVSKRGVKVDRAKLLETDILAKNGVIHAVDSVILPEK